MSLTTNPLLESALQYAAKGFRVLPLHYPIINKNGTFCSCHEGSDCESIGKHPQYHKILIARGVYDATTDESTIRKWWDEWPKANVGIATGAQSDLFICDADSLLIVNDADHRGLPPTPRVRTGNGQHAWFKHPGIPVPNKVKVDGFDFRGDGGLIVAPPSLHHSGRRYEWIVSLDTPLAQCPAWISALITKSPEYTQSAPMKTASIDTRYGLGALKRAVERIEAASNGHRNNTFYKAAASIYNLVAGGELTDTTADFELRNAAASVGLSNSEIVKTLNQAKQNGSINPRAASKKPQAIIKLFDFQFENSDLGNASRIVALYGTDIHYVGQWDSWVFWNGRYWQKDTLGHVPRLAYQMVRLMLNEAANIEDDEKRKKAIGFALNSQSRKALENMIALAKNQDGIRLDATAFDTDPWSINVINGTVNLKTGRLEPFEKNALLTKLIEIKYDPQAICPLWLSFLNLIFANDASLIDYVQRAVGYSLTGDVREDCLQFAYGAGGNGKSTFFAIMEKILGEYSHKTPSSMLMAQKFEGIPVDVADLQGKRFVVASEISKNVRWNEAKIKDLTGGDKLTARYMRANPFSFYPTHKLWIYGNYKPVVVGADEGIWRRMRLIPFPIKIPDSIKDEAFEEKLLAELPGILNWAIAGCLAWQQHGLKAPETIIHATKDYKEEMDKLQTFIDDRCHVGNERCLFASLYTTYMQYCKSSGEFCIDKREFKERLERKGYILKNGTGNKLYVFGLRHLEYNELIAQHEQDKKALEIMEV